MGDPKRITNKYQTPAHPWNKARLEQEKPLMQKYGLESKKELWKITSKLKTFKQNAKRLVALKGDQAEKERQQMFEKLKSFGLVESNSLDEILGMNPEQLLDRRLQTVVLKKGLARTVKQARQMITHRHIIVNGKKVTAPSYLVRLAEEHTVEFYPGSNFSREDHPERPVREQAPGKHAPEMSHKETAKAEESKDQKPKKPASRKPKADVVAKKAEAAKEEELEAAEEAEVAAHEEAVEEIEGEKKDE
jgi:small subunit ribosomal protein S4